METVALPSKKVTLQLVGLDSNAFALMGAFRKQARTEGWKPEEIEAVLDECRAGDYNHLLVTLMKHTEAPVEETPEELEEDYEVTHDLEDGEEDDDI